MDNDALKDILERMKKIEEPKAEPVPERQEEPRHVLDYIELNKNSKVEIVSTVAYLLGVPENVFLNPKETIDHAIFKKLNINRNAAILRALCETRTQLFYSYKRIFDSVSSGEPMAKVFDEATNGNIRFLENNGIKLLNTKYARDVRWHIQETNRIIQDRVNNIKGLFPGYVEWNYLKGMFVLEKGSDYKTIKEEQDKFYKYARFYPFGKYFPWVAPEDRGNILISDKRFVPYLYEMNKDTFDRLDLVSKASDEEKDQIFKFVEEAHKAVIIVDCENCDVFRVFSLLSTLEEAKVTNVEKIILMDDSTQTTDIWKKIENYTDIPVERIAIERVSGEKSRLDQALCVKLSKLHYKGNIDSFILVASDSDYLTLFEELDEARFYLMAEYEKMNRDYRKKLLDQGVGISYTNNFNGSKTLTIRKKLLYAFMEEKLMKEAILNLNHTLKDVLYEQHLDLSDLEKEEILSEMGKDIRTRVEETRVFLSFGA